MDIWGVIASTDWENLTNAFEEILPLFLYVMVFVALIGLFESLGRRIARATR